MQSLAQQQLRGPLLPTRRPSLARTNSLRTQAASQQGSVGALPDYRTTGSYRWNDVEPINITVGGDAELPIYAQLQPTLPTGMSHKAPLVIFSAGFLLSCSLYRSYAQMLASWGYAVVLYDVSEVMDDAQTVRALRRIMDTCLSDRRLAPHIDPNCIVLAGHSRGGKLSCLTAGQDTRVAGLLLLDPVDNTPMTPAGEGYPSCLPSLRRATAAPRNVPVLVVGAKMNTDIIPSMGSYQVFTRAVQGPFCEVDLLGAGHLSFVDKQEQMGMLNNLMGMFSTPPTTSDEAVREATKIAMLAWLDNVVMPVATGSGSTTSSPAALEQRLRQHLSVVQQQAPMKCTFRELNALRFASAGGANTSAGNASSSSTSSNTSNTSSSNGRTAGRSTTTSKAGFPPITDSYEELMKRRAKELKAMLTERGIRCDDCFEKEQLAKRIVEFCSPATVRA